MARKITDRMLATLKAEVEHLNKYAKKSYILTLSRMDEAQIVQVPGGYIIAQGHPEHILDKVVAMAAFAEAEAVDYTANDPQP